MAEYESAVTSEEKHEAMVKDIASKARVVVTTEDIYRGGSIHSSAAFWNNLLVFGAADKNVYALDKITGKLVWKFATNGRLHPPRLSMPTSSTPVLMTITYTL